MHLIKLKILLPILLLSLPLKSQHLDFFRERISIQIQDPCCIVSGTYYIRNTSDFPVNKIFYYPFSINEDMPFPDSISVFDRIHSKYLKYNRSESGIVFHLAIPPKSILIFDVYYRQRTKGNQFEYILTSTKKWQEALDRAEFLINIPANSDLMYSSYALNEHYSATDRFYYFKKSDFKPDKNLIISWK
jgi:hypothetical protein